MGYMHIENLYKAQAILLHKECYALEKVHGTSAHVACRRDATGQLALRFFSGGEKHERFVALFDQEALLRGFETLFAKLSEIEEEIVVYGEAYGGSQQRMSDTYGNDLKFIAFDLKIDGMWANVPEMHYLCTLVGFEVVPWERTTTDLIALDRIRDRPSEVAMRRGCGNNKQREGVVLRPIEEVMRGAHRLIVKHKAPEFRETKNPRQVDPAKAIVLREANAIAEEWVTDMRFRHVIDKLPHCTGMEHTKILIDAMVEDVYREGRGEIVESQEARAAICRRAAQMYKRHILGGN